MAIIREILVIVALGVPFGLIIYLLSKRSRRTTDVEKQPPQTFLSHEQEKAYQMHEQVKQQLKKKYSSDNSDQSTFWHD